MYSYEYEFCGGINNDTTMTSYNSKDYGVSVMEIQFKEKFLEKQTLHKTNDAKTLIKLIRNNDLLTGGEMAFYLAKMPQEIRKTIQYIRENSSKLLKPNEFLIAYNRGYEITTDKKKIKAWADKHHKKAVSGLKQVNEAWNAIQARK